MIIDRIPLPKVEVKAMNDAFVSKKSRHSGIDNFSVLILISDVLFIYVEVLPNMECTFVSIIKILRFRSRQILYVFFLTSNRMHIYLPMLQSAYLIYLTDIVNNDRIS